MDALIQVLTKLTNFLVGSGENPGVITQWLQAIETNELLLVFFGLSLVGLGIGIIHRLKS